MQRARLFAIAVWLAGCRPSVVEDSGDEGNTCASAMVFEGQCFESIDVPISTPMAASDIDGDGRAELFARGPDATLSRFELQGDAFVLLDELQTSFEELFFGEQFAFADLDGDGRREIVVNQNSWFSVFQLQDAGLTEIAVQPELRAYFPRAVGPIEGRELLLAESEFSHGNVVAYEWQGDALVKTVTVGNAGCGVYNDMSAAADFDANGIIDAAFAYWKGECPDYPYVEGGLLLVLVHADGTFQTAAWHWPDELAGVTAGELDGEPGDELLVSTSAGVHVFEGGPGIAALVPNEQLIEHFGHIGNLGGDRHNEMVGWVNGGTAIIMNPLQSPRIRPFFGIGGSPHFLADFNGDDTEDVLIYHNQWEGSTVWVSK